MRDKKQVYFVRHGETPLNAKNFRQGRQGPLSALGREQAAFVGERFTKIPVDIIFSSPYERAEETARIIASKIDKKVEVIEILSERRNPHEIIGRSSEDPEVATILDRIDRSFHTNDLRYSDEENFSDLKDRTNKLLRFLEARPEKQILCITHHIFLRCVAGYIEKGEKFTANDFAKFTFLNPLNNAGITLCTYEPEFRGFFRKRQLDPHENLGWKLVIWNDYGRIDPKTEPDSLNPSEKK
ncbi:MAG TPA: histidine phosphatase family protein [Candidatus Paceibacterota bacterium]|nr:histidine phosphatase family protein [Candidatus Paceibacterota bacterium]